jgi:leader peptidase (prepilin peptidase) / N-methyltransferase
VLLPLLWALVFGLLVGSFLNVCIYRIPRSPRYALDEDPLIPLEETVQFNSPSRSLCPKCRVQLFARDNLPVVSWILLQGKCRFCKTKISIRYPFVELLTGICAVGCTVTFPDFTTAIAIFVFLCTLIVLSFIDYDFYILPDLLTLGGSAFGSLIVLINCYYPFLNFPFVSSISEAGIGALSGSGFLLLMSEGYLRIRGKEGLGLGDVKLLLYVGILFGPFCALVTIFVGSLLGAVLGSLTLLLQKKGLGHHLPFGPFLAIGTASYLFFGAWPLELLARFSPPPLL